MTHSIFSLGKYMKKAAVTTLIFGLLISPSLALNSSSSQSLSTIVQALTGTWVESTEVDTDWYYIDENADEFTIGTAGELAGLAYLVNSGKEDFSEKTILLTKNIDLDGYDWEPIGKDEDNSFKGTFNGQDNKIENMYVQNETGAADDYEYAGLFGYIEDAMITKLEVSGIIDVLYKDHGGICGHATNSKIIKCNSNIEMIENSNKEGTYKNITVGEICGYAEESIIDNCRNYIDEDEETWNTEYISIETNCSLSVGGICGEARETEINDCINSVDVKATSKEGSCQVGGICGYACGSMNEKTIISNCKNSRDVVVNSEIASYGGGICGGASNTEIRGCRVIGYISASSDGGPSYVGGICGNLSSESIINNCGNFSKVVSRSKEYSYIGGICGISGAYDVTIDNCFNMGSLKSVNYNVSGSNLSYIGGICNINTRWGTGEVVIKNNYYKSGTAEKGIGSKDANDQEGTTALPESQMIAAAGTTGGEDWVNIVVDGDELEEVALVDALNTGNNINSYSWIVKRSSLYFNKN